MCLFGFKPGKIRRLESVSFLFGYNNHAASPDLRGLHGPLRACTGTTDRNQGQIILVKLLSASWWLSPGQHS